MTSGISREAEGLLLMVASTLFGTVMGVCAKTLGDWGLGLFVIILGSRVVLLLVTTATLIVQQVNPLRSTRKLLLLVRGLLGFSVITTIFWSVQLLPLADATVLSRLFPLFVALLAPLLLHEPYSPGVWLALPVCLVGVVVMARPSFIFGGDKDSERISASGVVVGLSQALVQALTPKGSWFYTVLGSTEALVPQANPALLLPMAQALVQALTRISVRSLGSTESSASIIMSGAVVTSTGAALMCALVPGQLDTKPSLAAYGLLGLMGCMAVGLQFTSTAALKRVRAAPAAAVNYLSVVWALAADYLMFGNRPTLLSLLGVALICASTLALMLWEARRGHRAPTSGHGRWVQEEGRAKHSEGEESGGDGEVQEGQRLLHPEPVPELQQHGKEVALGPTLEQELVEQGLVANVQNGAVRAGAATAGAPAAYGGSSISSSSLPMHRRQRQGESAMLPQSGGIHAGANLLWERWEGQKGQGPGAEELGRRPLLGS